MNNDAMMTLVTSYFDDIESRINKLDELVNANYNDEAFLLCSVYIESMANRYYNNYSSSKGFCTALMELSNFDIFKFSHPKQLMFILENMKMFLSELNDIRNALDPVSNDLQSNDDIVGLLTGVVSESQLNWINEYWYKLSMAMIAYERVRCVAVHDIWAPKVSFSSARIHGQIVPDIDYSLLKSSLDNIAEFLKSESIRKRNLFLRHNA